MKTTKIWIYGLDNSGDVVHKDWVFETISEANLEHMARKWKADYSCDMIIAVPESIDLRDAWFDYIKTRYSRNGLAAFAKMEFVDFLKSEGRELAKT